jgi:polar amino acid transport system substrate-binding protein
MTTKVATVAARSCLRQRARPSLALFALGILLVARPAAGDELAPTGTLRATFLAQNPVQGRVEPAIGRIIGPAFDLTEALARQRNLPFQITPAAGVRAVIESVASGAADIGFLAFDPERAVDVDFSQPYSLAYNSYLVPENSPIRASADVDRPGVRIGVGAGDAADLFLKRTLKQAQVKGNHGGSLAEAKRMLTAGEIDAYAANRQRLLEAAADLPGTRLLADNFLAVQQAIAVAKGNPARLAILDRFIEEARSAGLIRSSLDRARLNGVGVAPAR